MLAADGASHVLLSGNASVSTLATGLVPYGTYNVSWFQNGQPTPYNPSQSLAGNYINLAVNGLVVYSEYPVVSSDPTAASSVWAARTARFTQGSGSTATIKFFTTFPPLLAGVSYAYDGAARTTFVDGVQLTPSAV